MKLDNFLMSQKKWEEIVAELERNRTNWKRLKDLVDNPCGHCEEYYNECDDCTLDVEDICGDLHGDNNFFVLDDMVCEDIPRNKRKALSISRRILNAVLKDDPRIK